MKGTDMGELIGRYLRETRILPPEIERLSNEEIGKKVWDSEIGGIYLGSKKDRGGLVHFFEMYYDAREYFLTTGALMLPPGQGV